MKKTVNAVAGGFSDEIDLSGLAPVTRSIPIVGQLAVQAAAYHGEDLYFTTATLAHRYHPRDGVVQIELPVGVYTSTAVTRDGVVFVAANGVVGLAGRGGTLVLRGPVPRLSRAVGSPRSTRFVVAIADHLLLYDAASLLPRTIDTPLENTSFHGFAGNRHYLMGYMLDDWQQFELGGSRRSLGRAEFGGFVTAATDGSYVIARTRGARELLLLAPERPPMQLPGALAAVATSPEKVVLATDHEVVAIERGANRRVSLWQTTEPIRRLGGSGPFVVAVAKTALWRRDDRSGATSTVEWTAPPAALAVDPDGNAWLAVEGSLWKWGVDGKLAKVGQIARPIQNLVHVVGVGCVALDDRGGATVIAEGLPPRPAISAGNALTDVARGAPLATGMTQDRHVIVHDLDRESGHTWSLGLGDDAPTITDDGRFIATFVNNQIAIYTIELPVDRAAYEALLDHTTNLRLDEAGDSLVWPGP